MRVEAIVFVELDGQEVPAGRLRVLEDGRYSRSTFDYGRRYLDRPNAIALDPVQLPLAAERFETEEDFILFNGIRDAAPDAWGRRLIDMHMVRMKGRAALEQDYLFASQRGHRTGALRFGPTPAGPGPVLRWTLPDSQTDLGDLGELIALADAAMKGQSLPKSLIPYLGAATDSGGARPKATITIDGFPWLAKFSMESDRIDMPAAEAGCLDLCEMAGLETCGRRIETVGGRRVLLIERFDRTQTELGLRRIPMISSLSLLGSHEMDRGVSGYADIHDGLRRYGIVNNAGEQLFRRMVMNVLCGNTDDHYRNHAFLSENGLWRMSPTYDVTPTLQASTSRNLFLHLGKAGAGRAATLDAAVAGAESLGLQAGQARAIANELSEMVAANWRRVMTERGAGQFDLDLMANSFSEAGRTVEDGFEYTPERSWTGW